MTRKELKTLKGRISQAFRAYARVNDDHELKAILRGLPADVRTGKLYEAFILGRMIRELTEKEQCAIHLINGQYLHLKSAPGPINRRYP